jgi:hypothetical protein
VFDCGVLYTVEKVEGSDVTLRSPSGRKKTMWFIGEWIPPLTVGEELTWFGIGAAKRWWRPKELREWLAMDPMERPVREISK